MQYTLILILLRGGGSIQSGLLSQVNLFSENSGVDTSSPFGFGLCSPYLKKNTVMTRNPTIFNRIRWDERMIVPSFDCPIIILID